jgi:7,8-dihydropterin-6-yl-methyl-4-(beta-D-ribofuranosyl)aminobenzene 5'-phosphate synthase
MRIAILLALAAMTASAQKQVQKLEVRILSTMLADDDGFGEWGFAALVVADGHRILLDTGAHEDTVLRNLTELKVSLADVPDVILTHHHADHTTGLVTLRREIGKSNPPALARAHVAKGIFANRAQADGRPSTKIFAVKRDYEATGGKFIEYDSPRELFPGVWVTGPVPRKYPERNWTNSEVLVLDGGKTVEDNLPEDMALVIDTAKGLVVITGCGHAGIVNICDYARTKIRNAPLHAVIGGLHLYQASDETLAWTGAKLKEFGLENLLGAHCTGIEAVYRLRQLTGLTRATAVVGAVGAGFTLPGGLAPGSIAR